MEESHKKYLPPEWRDEPAEPHSTEATLEPNPEVGEIAPATPEISEIVDAENVVKPSSVTTPKAKFNAVESAAHWFSALFSPLLTGTYGILLSMWLSYLVYSPSKVKAIVVAITFGATCVVPVICLFLLSRARLVSDPSMNNRRDRIPMYVLTAFCYAGLAVYYHFVNAPGWLMMFVIGVGVTLIVMAFLSMRLNVSAHAAGVGALTALIFYLVCSGDSVSRIQWLFMLAVLISGCVCTSRLILNRHSMLEVGAGYALGFVLVFFPAWFILLN